MRRKARTLLFGVILAVALSFAGACHDPLDLPVPDPQPVEPFR